MTESDSPRIAGLLLAAGGSSRLGRPKQLVEFEGKTLIRRAAEALIDAGYSPVVVVLGAEIEGSREELRSLRVDIVENADWKSGMSSSIRAGIERLLIGSAAEAVLITPCDQPNVTADKLRRFLDKFQERRESIIAAEYDGILGVPAIFSAELFPALASLEGDKGARDLIRLQTDVISIPLPEAASDIDVQSDIR